MIGGKRHVMQNPDAFNTVELAWTSELDSTTNQRFMEMQLRPGSSSSFRRVRCVVTRKITCIATDGQKFESMQASVVWITFKCQPLHPKP